MAQRIPTVAMPILARIVAFAESRGVVRAEMVKQLGLEPGLVEDYDARVPHTLVVRAWELGAQLSRDGAFGLHMAQQSQFGEFDLFDFRFANSPTLLDALRQLVRHQRLIGDGTALLKFEIEGERVHIVLDELEGAWHRERHEMECLLALGLNRSRLVTGRSIEPISVSFRHAEPADVSEHRRIFRAPVTFSAPRHELVLPLETLSLPTIGSNPKIAAMMDRYAERLMSEMPPFAVELPVQVRQVIRELLRGTRPTLSDVARRLGIGARTLQRSLAKDGSDFQSLLEQVQFELAKRLLGERKYSADEVAFTLGFADRNTFHRAFRRWAGVTPIEFRRGQNAGGAPAFAPEGDERDEGAVGTT